MARVTFGDDPAVREDALEAAVSGEAEETAGEDSVAEDADPFGLEAEADDSGDDAADAAAEDSAASLFDDEDEEEDDADAGDKKDAKDIRVPKKRLDKVIAQRNEERARRSEVEAERDELKTKAAELEGRLKGIERFSSVVEKKYAHFKDPLGQLEWDSDFVEAFEKLSATDRTVAEAAKAVQAYMDTGRKTVTETSNQRATAEDAADEKSAGKTKRDPAVEKIIRRTAQQTIEESLKARHVRPQFRKLVQNHILSTEKDLAELDDAAVFELTKTFLKDNGFKSKDVLETPSKEGTRSGKKPATGTAGGPASRTRGRRAPTAGKEGGDDSDGPPKTIEEWEKRQSEKLRRFEDAFGAQG